MAEHLSCGDQPEGPAGSERRRIRVLAFIEARAAVGPAGNLIRLASAFRSAESTAGVEISIATYRRGQVGQPGDFVSAIRSAGVPCEVIQERRRFDPGVFHQIREIVQRVRPDIVQTHNVKSHLLVRWLGLWRSYPWIAFQHGYTATDLKDRLYNQIDRWSLLKTYRLVSVCAMFARRSQRWGVPADRIRVRHNAAPPFVPPAPDNLEQVRAQLDLAPGTALVLSVGRLSREKGHADLLDAAAAVRRSSPDTPVRFVFLGDGPERPALERRCRQAALDGIVTFAGHRRDVAPYYSLADALVLPSHTEGSPNVLLEAMAAGVPVVATAVGGVPEIVTDGETGLLATAGDIDSIASRIVRLLHDPALKSRLAQAAQRLVAERYSPAEYQRSMAQLYRDTVRSFYGDRIEPAPGPGGQHPAVAARD